MRNTYLFIILYHMLFFAVAMANGNIYLIDSYGYLAQAKNLFQYQSWYAEEWNMPVLIDYFSFRPPLYALLLGTLINTIGSVYVALLIQNILSILSIYTVIVILQKFKLNHRAIKFGTVASLIFFPTQLVMANLVMSEILFQFLTLQIFYHCACFYYHHTWKNTIIIGLLLSLVILTKPVGLFLIIPLLVYYFLVGYQKHGQSSVAQLAHMLLLLSFHFITLHLVSKQQEHQTGYYHYSSIKAVTQQRYHGRYTLAAKFGNDYADRWNDSCWNVLQAAPNYKIRYQTMEAMGDSIIKTYPFTFLYLYAKGIAVFFLDPGRHDLFAFMGISKPSDTGLFHQTQSTGFSAIIGMLRNAPILGVVILIASFFWNILVVLLILLFFLNKEVPIALKIVMFLFVGYFAAATGMLGVARYRSVIFPQIIIVVAYAFEIWFKYRKTKKVY